MKEILSILELSGYFLALFIFAELLYHFAKIKAEHTRKIVHIGTGLLTLLFPIYFEQTWQVIIICTAFLALLALSIRFRFLPSINAISRETSGSILYPIIVVIVFAFYSYMNKKYVAFNPLLYFYLPILIMAIADPLAAISGNYYKSRKQLTGGKTSFGSSIFLVVATLMSVSILWAFNNERLSLLTIMITSIIIGLVTTITERLSYKGWDNFTIPLVCCICLYITTLFAL